jgi:multicomponent Na+:H+ antiporter subunit D
VAQADLKRLLSFTLVSHIGYMLWGVATATTAGLSAAIFYVAHHITVQTSLFLVAGLVERRGGTTSLVKLGSLARLAPLLAVLYLVPALNLAGIPPFSGFLGKVGLMQAAASEGTWMAWMLIGAGLATSLLTLYAIVKAWNMAFWQEAPEELNGTPTPRTMTVSAGAVVALSLAMTVGAGPLVQYADTAARDLMLRTPYVAAVLPGGERGDGVSDEVAEEGERESENPTESPTDDPELVGIP